MLEENGSSLRIKYEVNSLNFILKSRIVASWGRFHRRTLKRLKQGNIFGIFKIKKAKMVDKRERCTRKM